MKLCNNLILGYIFTTVLGVILHFTYDWSGKNAIVGLFSATSESTWEHLKLVFYPMLLLTIINLICMKKNNYSSNEITSFLSSRTIGILAAMLMTVVLFYTLTGVFGKTADFVNIAIYFVAVAFGFYIENRLKRDDFSIKPVYSVIILCLFTFLFISLTYSAPDVGIFKNPLLFTTLKK